MSVERKCKACGELENIRLNFGDNVEAEIAFHNESFYCNDCLEDKMN